MLSVNWPTALAIRYLSCKDKIGPQIISLDSLCRGSGRKAWTTNVRVKNLTIIISAKFTKERKKDNKCWIRKCPDAKDFFIDNPDGKKGRMNNGRVTEMCMSAQRTLEKKNRMTCNKCLV